MSDKNGFLSAIRRVIKTNPDFSREELPLLMLMFESLLAARRKVVNSRLTRKSAASTPFAGISAHFVGTRTHFADTRGEAKYQQYTSALTLLERLIKTHTAERE